MAKDKSPKKESKKAKKSDAKKAIPDLSQAMKQVPMDSLKSLKVKMKFKTDKDTKDDT